MLPCFIIESESSSMLTMRFSGVCILPPFIAWKDFSWTDFLLLEALCFCLLYQLLTKHLQCPFSNYFVNSSLSMISRGKIIGGFHIYWLGCSLSIGRLLPLLFLLKQEMPSSLDSLNYWMLIHSRSNIPKIEPSKFVIFLNKLSPRIHAIIDKLWVIII